MRCHGCHQISLRLLLSDAGDDAQLGPDEPTAEVGRLIRCCGRSVLRHHDRNLSACAQLCFGCSLWLSRYPGEDMIAPTYGGSGRCGRYLSVWQSWRRARSLPWPALGPLRAGAPLKRRQAPLASWPAKRFRRCRKATSSGISTASRRRTLPSMPPPQRERVRHDTSATGRRIIGCRRSRVEGSHSIANSRFRECRCYRAPFRARPTGCDRPR